MKFKLNNNMNKNKSKWTRLRWSLISLLLFFFISAVCYYFFAMLGPQTRTGIDRLSDSWLLYSKKQPSVTFKSKFIDKMPNVSTNDPFVMRMELSHHTTREELLVKGDHQWITIRLGDKILYNRYGQTNPGLSLAVVPLPSDYDHQMLEIEVSSPYRNYVGILPQIYIGDADAMSAYVFSYSTPQILTMMLAISVGFGSLGFAIKCLYKTGRLAPDLILLGCFSLVVGLGAVSDDILSSLIFQPWVHSTLANLFTIATAILLISYYSLKMTRFKRPYQCWVACQIAFNLFILACAIFSKYDLPELMPWINTFNVLSTLVTAAACLLEAYHRNHFFVVCSPWIVLIAVSHCLLYIQTALGIPPQMINWSTLLFVVIMLLLVGYHGLEFIADSELTHKKAAFLQVKTELLEENHDLLREHLYEVNATHDQFVAQLKDIYSLVAIGDLTDTKDYLTQLIDEMKTVNAPSPISDNRLINLILTRYQKLAKKKSIVTDFRVTLPAILPIKENDLTRVLIHVLDHALRESYALENPLHRKVYLNMQMVGHQLLIQCEHNDHFEENVFDRGITDSLHEKEGMDLQMIQSVTEKYEGRFTQEKDHLIDRIKIELRCIEPKKVTES